MDVAIKEIEGHHGHYKNFITGNWKEELNNYKLHKQFNADIIDLLLHALVNATSTSCYVVSVESDSRDVRVEAIHPTRSPVVSVKEIFLCKIGQHYDAIIEANSVTMHSSTTAVSQTFGDTLLASAEDTTHIGDETTESQVPSIASKRASQISGQAESHGREQAKEKSSVQQQDTAPRRRMKKISHSKWEGLPVQKATGLPPDIDGDCIYQMPYDDNDRLASSKDGRPWKKAVTSNTKELGNGKRKIAKCKGSYECLSEECLFLTEYGKHNRANFDVISPDCVVCRICKSPARFLDCPAVKIWEFHEHYVIIKHSGKHTCPCAPLGAKSKQKIEENVKIRPDLPPKKLQREALLSQLYGGKNIAEVKETARAMIDTRKISTIRCKEIKGNRPLGHSIDALKKLKLDTEKIDRYYIFDIQDSSLTSDAKTTSHVFKMSKIAAKIAINMDKDGGHFMGKEYCFFDGNHKRSRGFITLGCYVYHPLLRKIIRLASMEVGSEDSESVQKFWFLFNKVLADYKGDAGYKFNPTGWCADEAGSNWEGLFRVFGDVRDRIVSCVFHFRQSVNRFSTKLATTKEQEKFKLLSIELQEAATQTKYFEIYEKLMRFIKKKNYREQLLLHWLEWWHKRRANIFNAFKPVHGAPKTNWAEAFHASWSHSDSINLSLVDAAYHDIVDAILTEVQIQEIGNGTLAPLRGPDEATRQAREFQEQKQRAKDYASTISILAKSLESAGSSFTVDPNSTHRPDKWRSGKRQRVSVNEVRDRADEIYLDSSSSE